MKKCFLKLLSFVIVLCVASSLALAQSLSEGKKVRVSGFGGAAIPSGEKLIKDNTKTGFVVGGLVAKELTPHWEVGLAYDYFDISNDKKGFDHKGQLATVSAMYSFLANSRWTPYLDGGFGLGQYKLDRKFNQLSAKASAGIEYFLTYNVSARAGVNYYYMHRQSKAESDLHMIAPTISLSYFFGAEKPKELPKEEAKKPVQVSKEPKQSSRIEGCPISGEDVFDLDLRVLFEFNKAIVRQKHRDSVRNAAGYMNKCTNVVVEVQGHTDNVGAEAYNKGLSVRRADIVKKILVEEYGIDESRIKTEGFGYSRPASSNKNAKGRAKNRRAVGVFIAR